jgi:hypothetical protein
MIIAEVETEKDAHMMQVHFCRLVMDGRYIWTNFRGTLEHFYEVAETVKAEYESWRK